MKEILLVPAVATLIACVIAGVVSLVVSILTKDQKTSEFRQAWIDGLRNDVSQLVGHHQVLIHLVSILKRKTKEDAVEFFLANQKEWLEICMLESRIRLRLNPQEHGAILKLLADELKDQGENGAVWKERAESICQEAQVILKSEWERVKVGEPSIIWLRRCSKLAIFAALLLAAVLIFNYFCVGFECFKP
jgi:hypothetical protein